MSLEDEEPKIVLPHHEQQPLCSTRLSYRQGRKLTAVKVYTINNESNHLLVFGVPSLNLRQEAKSLFLRYGKLLQFTKTSDYPTEQFTETYHCAFQRIQSARIAKRTLDTHSFYGGLLHICYAPELETVEQTRMKLLQRQRDVFYRLRNLEKDKEVKSTEPMCEDTIKESGRTSNVLNMGEVNTISIGKQIREVVFNRKRSKKQEPTIVIEKKFKPCFMQNELPDTEDVSTNNLREYTKKVQQQSSSKINESSSEIEVVDCTSAEKETLSNINEALNYNKFGNEVIRKVENKPVNKIKFNIVNKKLL